MIDSKAVKVNLYCKYSFFKLRRKDRKKPWRERSYLRVCEGCHWLRENDHMNQDEQHLNLLSIFHYIVGGVTALFSCMLLLYVAMGIAMLYGAFEGENPPPRVFAWFFILFPAVFMLAGWTLSWT